MEKTSDLPILSFLLKIIEKNDYFNMYAKAKTKIVLIDLKNKQKILSCECRNAILSIIYVNNPKNLKSNNTSH